MQVAMKAVSLPIEDILATSPFPPSVGRVLGYSRRGGEMCWSRKHQC